MLYFIYFICVLPMTTENERKPRRGPVAYEQVASLCDELLASGQNVSIPALHNRLGGSFTTLSRHKRAWEASKLQRFRRPLPVGVLEALETAHQAMRDDLAARLRDARQNLHARIKRAHTEKIGALSERDAATARVLAFEDDLATSRITISDLQQQVAVLSEQSRAATRESAQLRELLADMKKSLDDSRRQSQKEIHDLQNKLADESARTNQIIEQRDNEIRRLRDLLDQRTAEHASESEQWAIKETNYQADLRHTKAGLDAIKERLSNTEDVLSSTQKELIAERATIASSRENILRLEATISELRAERDSLLQAAERALLLQEQVDDLRRSLLLREKSDSDDG